MRFKGSWPPWASPWFRSPWGDDLIRNTIEGLKEINPGLIVAGHCTGFRALTKLAAAFPDSFMVSCVGTRVLIVGG